MNFEKRVMIMLYLVGSVLLILSEVYFTPTVKEVNEISKESLGTVIKTTYTTKDVSHHESITRMKSHERNDLTFISFTRLQDVHENDTLTVIGEVDLYQGSLQVVLDSIEKNNQ